ncbi:MAG: response regulator transcription factor [Clostridiales bacterium]
MKDIMLVEDDLTLAQGIKFSLELEGFKVYICNCLEEAGTLFNEREYKLILLDVMLPDGLGYDFCKKIRLSSNIPIIFLTACDEEVNIVQGLDIGGDDYITKPFRLKELISRINVSLRRTYVKEDNKVLKSGDLKINILECRVFKNEIEVELTSVEYRLLLFLIDNYQRVLSRNNILEKIWSIDSNFIDNNTLTVYIKRLREKIEDNDSNINYIKTIRGLGYMWNIKVR